MRLVLIAEARADADFAKQLADRVLIECGPEWVTADAIEDLRSWTGIEAGTSFTEWHNLKRLAESRSAGRRALVVAVAVAEGAPIGAVVLIHDLDNQPERRTGLEEARKETEPEPCFPILIGTPNPEREVWILNGFVAKSDSKSRRLERVKNRLGFDPTQQPHRLRGDRRRSNQDAGRDIKKGSR